MNLTLLDCTLRDGGYYTDWNFEEQVLLGAIETMKLHSPVIIAEVENKKQKSIVEKVLSNIGYLFQERHRKDYIWIKG